MPFGVGVPELIIILVIVLLVFGPKRLPMLGRQLGGGLREFKDSVTGKSGGDDDDDEERSARPELARSEQADVLNPEPDPSRATRPTHQRDESATRTGRDSA
jgi:sec-independent protein translocase protein TatA